MRAHRAWRSVGQAESEAEIERLRSELKSLGQRIDELEKQHPQAATIEALKGTARNLAQQLDELRCHALADELKELLRK